MRFGIDRRRLFAFAVAAVMLAGLAPLTMPGSASAVVLPSPTLTSPSGGATVTGNPVFAWTAVASALKYRIEVSTSSSFSPTVAADETQNLRYAPATELPLGTLWWRVAARDSGNILGTYAVGTFTKQWGASPTTISPPLTDPGDPDGVVSLAFPTDPLLFTWQPLAGAQSYELQVDDAADFIGATSYTTSNTAYVITEPRTVGQTFFWRLRGVSGGNFSNWSSVGMFRSTWSTKPNLVYPADNAVNVTDVYFDWDPVLGAAGYQLQVDPNSDFSTPIFTVTNDKGTRYVPAVPLNNGNYFWRVRALDAASSQNFGPWSDIHVFQRGWSDTPTQISPVNGGSTTTPDLSDPSWQNPTFSWTPARNASWYRIRFSIHPDMSSPTGCLTNRTTWTPYGSSIGTNMTVPGTCSVTLTPGTMYWDVAALDNPVLNQSAVDLWGPPSQTSSIIGLRSSIFSFTYAPPSIGVGPPVQLVAADYLTPARCDPNDACSTALADTPTFSWNAIPGATGYTVTVALDPNFTNIYRSYDALTNRLTPRDSWFDNQANQAYYWTVTPDTLTLDIAGCPTDHNKCSVFQKRSEGIHKTAPALDAVLPNDFSFSWQDYLATNQALTPSVPQEAKQYRIDVSTVSDFATIIDTKVVNTPFYTPWDKTYPEGPIYWRVQAIDGSNNNLTFSSGNGHLTKQSPAPTLSFPANAATVKGVPYLQWAPLAYAASYDVQIDNDSNFSSPITTSTTKMTAWAYTASLPAGTYYWRVRRNDADARDGAWSAIRSFMLAPSAPTLVSPTNGSFPNPATLLLQWTATQPAPKYQVEVSTSPTIASFIAGFPQVTVMTSWAPKLFLTNDTYYWRVKALNASGTPVATSTIFSFTIGEPTPFTDISSSPFKSDIEWVYLQHITAGCTTTTYCPDDPVTRAQMATFLARALHLSGSAPDAFTDDNGSIYEPNINLVAQAGIASGCGGTLFCPNDLVSRAQMATFLARALHLSGPAPDAFTDDNGSIYEPNINLVAREGIATGCGGTLFCPNANVTRGQMAAFLHRAFGP